MAYFSQQLINAITLGAIYGLIAIGYTMVYGIIGMINFAHGEVFMIGAFISLIGFMICAMLGIGSAPVAIVLVLLLAMAFTAVYGWAIERAAYRPLRGSFRLAPLISAIGVSIAAAELRPAGPGRAAQAGRPDRRRRLQPVQRRRLRRARGLAADHHRRRDRGADGGLLLADRRDAARPPAARLRAGHEDGVAAGRRRRPHDLAHLRAWARRWPPSPA